MNPLATLGGFSANASKGDDRLFTCDDYVSFSVPTNHDGVAQSFGGGTLALQISRDNGTSYETYTDTAGNAATITAFNSTKLCFFPGPTRVRLNLSASTSPDIDCVWMSGKVYLEHV